MRWIARERDREKRGRQNRGKNGEEEKRKE